MTDHDKVIQKIINRTKVEKALTKINEILINSICKLLISILSALVIIFFILFAIWGSIVLSDIIMALLFT